MKSRSRLRLHVEALEQRELPATNLLVPLDPLRDASGKQILTVQRYTGTELESTFWGPVNAFAVFDTGSPTVSFGYYSNEQLLNQDGDIIPIKVPLGSVADAIGGRLFSDIGFGGTISNDGLHALQLTWDIDFDLRPAFGADFTLPTAQHQMNVHPISTPLANGELDNPNFHLPTLAGTPLLAPSAAAPGGRAALITFDGAHLDFTHIQNRDLDGDGVADHGEDPAWIITLPDVEYIDPNTTPTAPDGSSPVVYIPLTLNGPTNVGTIGEVASVAPVPTQDAVALKYASTTLAQQRFLVDTGSQVSTISTALAQSLGLDLSQPGFTTTIVGAGGVTEDVPGYVLDELTLPLSDGGTITWTHVPVHVIDVPGGYAGVLGTNILNTASIASYDPYRTEGAALGVSFWTNRPADPAPRSWAFSLTLELAGLISMVDFPQGFLMPGARFSTGQVTGQVFQDDNRNGSLDSSESALPYSVVYADLNNNLLRDSNEPFANSGGTGFYSLSGLPSNKTSTIRMELYQGLGSTPRSITPRSGQASIQLNLGAITPPPQVATITINNGDAQRSMVTSVTLTFNQEVRILSDAFILLRNGGKSSLSLRAETSTEGGITTVTLTFPGNGSRANSLRDGDYQLVVRSHRITGLDGRTLDGNSDFKSGDNYSYRFHRLFGDVNGDHRVNQIDYVQFRQAMADGYFSELVRIFDSNGNKRIDVRDYLAFLSNRFR